jgi:hypothetical protein
VAPAEGGRFATLPRICAKPTSPRAARVAPTTSTPVSLERVVQLYRRACCQPVGWPAPLTNLPLTGIPFVILLLCWIVTTIGRIRIANRHAEVWGRLVDKLDSTSVGALVAQDGGRALESILSGPERPHARIIVAAQASVVLLALGAVLLAYAFTVTGVPKIIGAMVLALALGLGGAAGVGYWLSDQWGLLGPRNDVASRRAG